ncbi:prepilin peptidase [Patescibacteria group bacterium]|nr:prepilin peptidase [Patescibacteria group bacterium]
MENLIAQIGIFIFGTIIGSFLNVVILRYSEKSLTGRSECVNCHKKLNWYELIPIISFLIQGGKCLKCKKNISWQYPLVELSTALLFLFGYKIYFLEKYSQLTLDFLSIFDLFSLWLIFSLLIIIFVYDLYHKLIPDLWVFLLAFIALIRLFTINFQGFGLLSFFWAGFILAFPFVFLWIISKGEWLGLGDAKLVIGIGWFLGLVKGSSAIILGIWMGAIIGLFLVFLTKINNIKRLSFLSKNFTIKSELPFAPFLIIGTLLVFFFGWDVWGLSLILK